MVRNIHIYAKVLIILVFALWSASAQAGVDLRWSPSDTTVVPSGGSARLSIHIDEAINLRTVEITVTYDTTVVKSLGGGPGALYADSGYFVFQGFEEEPGSWHGFAIVMGAGEYITGPGELLYWNVEGMAEGLCPVVTVEAILYDEASPPLLISEVSLPNALVIVGDPLSAIMDVPVAGVELQVIPNPFNPRTRISFAVEQDTPAHLSVFDARGHRIAVLHDGFVQTGNFSVDWDGKDGAGRSQPGGLYFFLLATESGNALARGILLK